MQDREKKRDEKEQTTDDQPVVMLRLSRKTLLLAGLVCANVAVITVLAFLFLGRSSPNKEETTTVETKAVDPLRTTARADALLLSGRTKAAVELYRLAAKPASPHATAIAYRIALGMELQGELKDALQYYEIANSQDLSEISLAAQLGEARVYYKLKKFEAANRTLSPLAAVSALPVLAKTKIGAEVHFLRALARSAEHQAALPSSMLQARYLFPETIELSVATALQFVPLEGNQLGMPIPIGDDTRMGIKIFGSPREPETTLGSCGLQNQPASVLLELLARETGWKFAISPKANEVLSAKRMEVQIQDKTISELLAMVLEPLGLFWDFQGDTLIIDRTDAFSHEVVAERRRNHSATLLLNSLAEAPSHELAPQVYLALGNLAAMNQRYERAATFYQDLKQRYPKHPITQRANMNFAKTLLAQSQREQAEEILYEVVDSRRSIDLAPLAFLMLGDSRLAAEDLEKAKRHLSRSLALATEPEVTATAAMMLAAVYLMQRNESSSSTANAVLMDHREVLRDPRWSESVVFLSALTRYRVAISPGDVRRRGRELVAAAAKVDPGSFFGGYGYLLVGDAFSELSLISEATRLYDAGLKQDLPGPIRDMLLYRLATEYRNQNQFELAQEKLEELASRASSGLAPIATVDLAEMMLRQGDLQECIGHCRIALLQDQPEAQQMKLLRTLGRAYQELGNFEQASLCFGGFLPASTIQTAELSR